MCFLYAFLYITSNLGGGCWKRLFAEENTYMPILGVHKPKYTNKNGQVLLFTATRGTCLLGLTEKSD